MQAFFLRFLGLITILTVFFASCKKEDIINPKPPVNPPVSSNLFQFAVETLPGAPVGANQTFNAWVTIVNNNDDTVIKNQVLPFQLNDKYLTSQLELPSGEYRLVRFRITNQNVLTKYASPMVGSQKASEVSKPLSIAFTLPKPTVCIIPVEVAVVSTSDIPQNFGYPEGYFNQPDPSKPDEGLNYFRIKLAAFAQIGNVRYDNLAANVTLTITDNQGQQSTRNLELIAGRNDVLLPKNASRFQFVMNKWGIRSEVSLDISQIREGDLYGIGGSREAKKLKSEVVYQLTNGHYVAESKVDYLYDRAGKIGRIDYYKKKTDGRPYIDMYEIFEYDDDKVVSIKKYNETNQLQSETAFTYYAFGRIKAIRSGNEVSYLDAAVTYFQSPNRNNTQIKYTYSHGSHTMQYNMAYQDGNLVETNTTTSFGNSEEGLYQYDANINPFVHVNRPDLYLSGQSKNNVLTQQITFGGSYPQSTPYKFDYTYDNDGYPKEVIKSFKSPSTNTHSYTLKTVYTYL